jgi:hypothetical protein
MLKFKRNSLDSSYFNTLIIINNLAIALFDFMQIDKA